MAYDAKMAKYVATMNEVKSLRDFAYSEFCSDSIRKIYVRIALEMEMQAIDSVEL